MAKYLTAGTFFSNLEILITYTVTAILAVILFNWINDGIVAFLYKRKRQYRDFSYLLDDLIIRVIISNNTGPTGLISEQLDEQQSIDLIYEH